ncbi:hypothetical protein [Mycolicibacterium palauense]|uniref:hypothetical protein n=1 Tax=Mycolicibacterium palauense TaxID=2034511 RepID=UPI000BFF0AEA|nr:hypothetical protein [Mycolicibacterium palauense]
MTGNKFDGQTTWEPTDGLRFTWNGGWEVPGQDFVIDKEDLYWTTNLDKAQRAYGDPNIHYNTDDNGAERYLVFGDGTRVPADGTLAYRDSASNQNWINNGDGTFTKADQNFKPMGQAFPPAGYRRMADGRYAPIDSRGNQVGPLNDQPANYPGSPGWHESPNGVFTPLNTNGDYYQIDPATGQHKYFDKNGNQITKEKYFDGTPVPQQTPDGRPAPPAPGNKPPLQSTQVSVPDGMSTPEYPAWATDVDPDIPNQMTGVVVRLYELFGSGSPATSELPEFPFSTDTGERSGIEAYDDVKPDFKRIESEFDAAAKAFKTAVDNSANVTKAGRDAINNAIGTFNSTAKALEEGDWDGLLQAESTLLDTVKTAVEKAANTQQDVPSNPSGGPPTPMGPAADPPPAIPSAGDPSLSAPPADDKGLEDLLNGGMGSPFGGMPMGGNPLGGLGGMNPLGGLGGGGNPMGGGGNPLSPLSDAVKPLSKLAETDTDKPEDKKSPITPLNAGPQTPAPPPAAPAEPAAVAGTTPPVVGNQPATATPAGNSNGSKPTVTLPDGKVVEAPNQQAADAAQNAIDKASPGGDAAQKAYSPTGLDLPGDGKNLGAKVDPSDMQPGDVLKWQDKTMVAVAPGLVADPSEAGKIHTLEEVFKDQKGFEGVFRPTETDPTLSTHTSAPPLTDPQAPPQQPQPDHTPPGAAPPPSNDAPHPAPQPPPTSVPAEPPPDSVPLSGPGPAGTPAPQQAPPQQPAPPPSSTVPQAAPPSPFEDDAPPPATRTTKQERIAAGLE